MSWTKLSDDFFRHRKTSRLSNEAILVYLFLLTECAAQETDGEVFAPTVRMAIARFGADHSVYDELVRSDMISQAGDGSLWITNYLEYNPSRSEVQQQRQAKTERQDRWRKSRSASRDADVDALQDSLVDGAVDATQDASLSRERVDPVPVPVPLSQTRPQDIPPSSRRSLGENRTMPTKRGSEPSVAYETYPVGWEDADKLSPGALMKRYQEIYGEEGEGRLSAWLSAARKQVHSQPAYLRPCILGWLRGDDPDPVTVAVSTTSPSPSPYRSINASAAANAEKLRAEHGSVASALSQSTGEQP